MTRPFAILISGAAGTGKSTLAAALAPRIGAAILDLDVATGPLTDVVSTLLGRTDLSDPQVAELTRAPRYETLLALAEDNLRAGTPVILVAPFTAERSPAGWAVVTDRLEPHAAGVLLVWLDLPPDHLVARLKRRAAVRDSDKVRNPDAFLAGVHRAPPAVPHLRLDATRPVAVSVQRVADYMARHDLAIDGTP